jgi:3-methyl-2-oxobutanoate hydroxymethyltransferase
VSARERWTAPRVRAQKGREPLVVLTAYDFPTARAADDAGVDILLVGDSLGMVVLGYESTIPVTLDDMVHHTKAVVRARPAALVVADLPFLTYQSGTEQAMRSSGRLLQEAGADAVKLEGGRRVADTVRALVEAGVPVMGHVGLTPQSVLQLGGFRVQGRGDDGEAVLDGARALADAGAFAIVLESVPAALAERITASIAVPTIGIGAGPKCDGQVLVWHDLLGFYHGRTPRFVRRYAALAESATDGVKRFAADVRAGRFPSSEESYE